MKKKRRRRRKKKKKKDEEEKDEELSCSTIVGTYYDESTSCGSNLVEKPLQTVDFEESILRVIDSDLYEVQCNFFLAYASRLAVPL